MRGMTKRERQVTDENQIRHILDTAKVLHLGLAVDNEPYVVPMNYGYTMEEGKLVLYLHSALQGKKIDMMRANPSVFFELDCDLVPFEVLAANPELRGDIAYDVDTARQIIIKMITDNDVFPVISSLASFQLEGAPA